MGEVLTDTIASTMARSVQGKKSKKDDTGETSTSAPEISQAGASSENVEGGGDTRGPSERILSMAAIFGNANTDPKKLLKQVRKMNRNAEKQKREQREKLNRALDAARVQLESEQVQLLAITRQSGGSEAEKEAQGRVEMAQAYLTRLDAQARGSSLRDTIDIMTSAVQKKKNDERRALRTQKRLLMEKRKCDALVNRIPAKHTGDWNKSTNTSWLKEPFVPIGPTEDRDVVRNFVELQDKSLWPATCNQPPTATLLQRPR